MLTMKQGQCRARVVTRRSYGKQIPLNAKPMGLDPRRMTPQGTNSAGIAFAHVRPGACSVAATVTEWEQAEIHRSEFEAAHTPAERLIASEPNVARYMNPPRDTAYPLEYAFA